MSAYSKTARKTQSHSARGYKKLGAGVRRIGGACGPGPTVPLPQGRSAVTPHGAEREAEIKANKRKFIAPSKETLGHDLAHCLDERKAELEPTTWASYEGMMRCHITPALGQVKLDELSPVMVKAWIADMVAGRGVEVQKKGGEMEPKPVSPSTAAYARRVLRIALKAAVKGGIVVQSVVDRTSPPKQDQRRRGAFTVVQRGAKTVPRCAHPFPCVPLPKCL